MNRYLTLSLALLPLLLSGCASIPIMPEGETAFLELAHLRSDLAPFEDNERYDYLEDEIEYAQIGAAEFDSVFYRSALFAGRLHQIRQTLTAYRGGNLNLQDSGDTSFLLVMTSEALSSLPTIVTDAQSLAAQVAELEPGSLSIVDQARALMALQQARSNIQLVLGSREDVGAILDDFRALQADLELVQEAAFLSPTQPPARRG